MANAMNKDLEAMQGIHQIVRKGRRIAFSFAISLVGVGLCVLAIAGLNHPEELSLAARSTVGVVGLAAVALVFLLFFRIGARFRTANPIACPVCDTHLNDGGQIQVLLKTQKCPFCTETAKIEGTPRKR